MASYSCGTGNSGEKRFPVLCCFGDINISDSFARKR